MIIKLVIGLKVRCNDLLSAVFNVVLMKILIVPFIYSFIEWLIFHSYRDILLVSYLPFDIHVIHISINKVIYIIR